MNVDAYRQLIRDTLAYAEGLPEDSSEPASVELAEYFPSPVAVAPPLQTVPNARSQAKLYSPPAQKIVPPVAEEAKPEKKPSSPQPAPANQIADTLQKIAPHLRLTSEVPDDAQAKRIASGWQEKIPGVQVVLLVLDSDSDTLEFVKNLGKAIHTQLAPTKVLAANRIEQENKWDLFLQHNPLKLAIATEGLKRFPHLMSYYKSLPAQELSFLGSTPFLLLESAPLYQTHPEKKALLWKTLCQILKR